MSEELVQTNYSPPVPGWTFWDRMRKAREDAGLSQKDLSDLIGCGRDTVGAYEPGAAKHPMRPRRAHVLQVAAATGCDFGWLWAGRPGARPRRGTPPSDGGSFAPPKTVTHGYGRRYQHTAWSPVLVAA